MSIAKFVRIGCALAALVCAGTVGASAQLERPPKTAMQIHSLTELDGGHAGQKLKVLLLQEESCRQMATRYLLELASGERAVLDYVFVHEMGVTRMALRDDASDWSAELQEIYEHGRAKIERLNQLRPSLWAEKRWFEGDHELIRSLDKDGKELARLVSPSYAEGASPHALYSQLDEDVARALAGSMPRAISRLLLTLDSIEADRGDKPQNAALWDPLLQTLSMAIRSYGAPSAGFLANASWDHEPIVGGREIEFLHGPVHAFISSFESIANPRDPMADLRGPADGGCVNE